MPIRPRTTLALAALLLLSMTSAPVMAQQAASIGVEVEGAEAAPSPSEASPSALPAPGGPASPAPPPEALPASLAPPPVGASTSPSPPPVTVSVEPGRGLTVARGDDFALNLAARLQLRDTLRVDPDVPSDADSAPEVTNELQIRTVRLWFRGHVFDPNVRYGVQLALGGNDFEAGQPSPLFDAFLDLTHLRDLSVRVGQFFVPFDRARTVREFALETVDRTEVVRELTLDRDVGLDLYSEDLFGLGGRLAYHLGVFGGDGRNRFGGTTPGFLWTLRLAARPFGAFDDDREGDLARTPDPRLAVGLAVALNQQTDRPRSTTGTPTSATFDQLHAAADLVFKWHGFSVLSEVVWRQSSTPFVDAVDGTGETVRTFARNGLGGFAQVSQMLGPRVAVWARYEHLVALCPGVLGASADCAGANDPGLVDQVNGRGRGLGAGANLYLHGHALKVQLDWTHAFGGDRIGVGPHTVRLQLDASF